MPGMSGIELGEEIKRLYPSLPVILTSGYSTVLAENGGHGFDLVHEPYSIEALSKPLKKGANGKKCEQSASRDSCARVALLPVWPRAAIRVAWEEGLGLVGSLSRRERCVFRRSRPLIPTRSRPPYRFEAGQHSDLKPAIWAAVQVVICSSRDTSFRSSVECGSTSFAEALAGKVDAIRVVNDTV